MSPTKSLRDVRSRRISIFIVNTFVSLGCSGNTTRIMRRTLKDFILFFTMCETISIWKCVLVRFNDDLVALDSIVRFDPLLETGEASPD